MGCSRKQGDLFKKHSISTGGKPYSGIDLSNELLKKWQKRLHNLQQNLFLGKETKPTQASLFKDSNTQTIKGFAPLTLTPLPINFWQWPKSPHNGPAIYLVMDRPQELNTPLLLYIGETISNLIAKESLNIKKFLQLTSNKSGLANIDGLGPKAISSLIE